VARGEAASLAVRVRNEELRGAGRADASAPAPVPLRRGAARVGCLFRRAGAVARVHRRAATGGGSYTLVVVGAPAAVAFTFHASGKR
jgi:hypothetical protein